MFNCVNEAVGIFHGASLTLLVILISIENAKRPLLVVNNKLVAIYSNAYFIASENIRIAIKYIYINTGLGRCQRKHANSTANVAIIFKILTVFEL